MNLKQFEKIILRELINENLAIFAGAGLSMGSGYVSWKELLRDIATDINLEIDKEHDLLSVAQYHVNKRSRNRINEKILNEFSEQAIENPMMNVICRLPIDTIWTTNYDKLIEESMMKINKIVDVKITKKNLALNKKRKDVILFKIHGDKDSPENAIITRDDYENFFRNKELFVNRLLSDLVSKTFLFIGYSFGDPNFEHVLSKIRYELGDDSRQHYCFQQSVKRSKYDNDDDYNYAKIKQELRIEDLGKYNIETILVEEYSEITEFLGKIEFELYKKNIFISGSAHEYKEFGSSEDSKRFITKLIYKLISEKNKIISGYGLGVGGYVVDGLVSGIFDNNLEVESYYLVRPFPQNIDKAKDKAIVWDNHRRRMISESTVSIFIFGNKLTNNKIELATGVYKEFVLSKENGNVIIPIASTGYMSKQIIEECKEDKDLWYLTDSYDVLCKEKNVEKIVDEIKIILNRYKEGQ